MRELAAVDERLRRWKRVALAAGLLLALPAGVQGVGDPAAFLRAYVVAFLYVLAPSGGALGLLLLHRMTGGRWGDAIEDVLIAATRVLPLVGLLFVPIVIGGMDLLPWSAGAMAVELSGHQALYLARPFVLARAVLYFVAWIAFARMAASCAPERRQLVGAGGFLVYVLTMSFAAVDWGMSLSHGWYSSIYGLLLILGQGLSALSMAILVRISLAASGPRDEVRPEVLLDLGTLLFALVMTWAYLGFSQLIIVWSANLPEQVEWYVRRLSPGWRALALALVLFHFALPFFLLLTRRIKRRAAYLGAVCALVFAARLPELIWMIAPSFHPDAFHVGWLDVELPLTLFCFWTWWFLDRLGRRRADLPHTKTRELAATP